MNTLTLNWRYGKIDIFCDDNILSDSLLLYGEWAQNEIDFLMHIIEKSKHRSILLGGANIGVQTIAISNFLSGKDAIIHCIELHPQIYSILVKNLAINNCKNVHPHLLGLNDSYEEIVLPKLNESISQNIGAFSLHQKYNSPEHVKATLNSIDSLELESCDLIHLDVERHELSSLKGANETIQKYHPDIYAEVLNYNHAKSLYGLLKDEYSFFYLHAPKAYNESNFFREQTDIFNSSREYAILCSNHRYEYRNLFRIYDVHGFEKIFDTFSSHELLNTKSSLRKSTDRPRLGRKKYNFQLFIDDGKGFTEEHSIVQVINSRYGTLNFDLSVYPSVFRIRIDPNDNPCIIRILDVSIANEEGVVNLPFDNAGNAYLDVDGYFLFDTDDPQIIISELQEHGKINTLNIDIEYFELNNDFLKIIFNKLYGETQILKQELASKKDDREKKQEDIFNKLYNETLNLKAELLKTSEISEEKQQSLYERVSDIQQLAQNFLPVVEQMKTIESNLMGMSHHLGGAIEAYLKDNQHLRKGMKTSAEEIARLQDRLQDSEVSIKNRLEELEGVLLSIKNNQDALEKHLKKSFFARLFGNSHTQS